MPGIGIMTDSNCGIMPSEEKTYGIHVLPMPIIIDGETFYEGINITPEDFYKKTGSRFHDYHVSAIARRRSRNVG